MQSKRFVKLFSNCIIVSGASRGLLCDLQLEKSYQIPKELVDLSKYFDGCSIDEIKNKYDEKSQGVIDEYIEFLIQNNFAFYLTDEERNLFPALSMQWDYPAKISNAIIDLDVSSSYDVHDIFKQLEELGCRDIQLRICYPMTLDSLAEILAGLDQLILKSVQVFIPSNSEVSNSEYAQFVLKYVRVTAFYIYAADNDELLTEDLTPGLIVAKIKDNLQFPLCCGVVDKAFFATNTQLFTESMHYNTCLNRKLSIDSKGMIKNCPSANLSFGNVTTTRLGDALLDARFSQLWKIKKDEIKVCQDCEFRYICTDCRMYLTDPADEFSKPLKCSYDPYTGQWLGKEPEKQLTPTI